MRVRGLGRKGRQLLRSIFAKGCKQCRCNARQRAAAHVLLSKLGENAAPASVYCTEQARAFFMALRRCIVGLIGSGFAAGWWQRLRLTAWPLRYARVFVPIRLDVTALRLG